LGSVSMDPATGSAEACYGPGFTIPDIITLGAQICGVVGGTPSVVSPANTLSNDNGASYSGPSLSPAYSDGDSDSDSHE
jgi:hypothetical protein